MKLQTPFLIIGLAVSACIIGVGCSGGSGTSGDAGSTGKTSSSSAAIMGAGSSFVAPAMDSWVYEYKSAKGVAVNYQSVGSGAGVADYKSGTVDFGATDAPLSDKDLGDMPSPTAQFPIVAGCEVLAYYIPGVDKGLKLTPETLAGIYLGDIKMWDDPKILADNAGVKLPHLNINVVYRSDASGTTYIFTDYLSNVSPDWKTKVGQGKSVSFPTGVGAKGNEGVAGMIKQTPGSIGYVELAYAVKSGLTFGPLKNQAGNFVLPSIESTAAAADAAADVLKKDIRSSIVNQPGKDSYPIAGMTYVIVSKQPKDAKKGEALKAFLNWDLTDGQGKVATLQYAPLPAAVVKLSQDALGVASASETAKQ